MSGVFFNRMQPQTHTRPIGPFSWSVYPVSVRNESHWQAVPLIARLTIVSCLLISDLHFKLPFCICSHS